MYNLNLLSSIEYTVLVSSETVLPNIVSNNNYSETTGITLSHKEILKIKRQIIFDDLLKPTQHSDGLKFVLVEGAPGIGKSTLAKEICQRWATIVSVYCRH